MNLVKASDLSVQLPTPNAQIVILTDASFYAALQGIRWLRITSPIKQEKHKKYIPTSISSKIFTLTYLKLSLCAKEVLAVQFALYNFADLLWGSSEPVQVLTDNRSQTKFFLARTIPSKLGTGVDLVLKFNFVFGYIPGNAIAAADHFSRIHVHPHTKLKLRFNSQRPVKL